MLLDRSLAHLHRLEQAKAPSAHILASWRRDALILALLAVRPLRLANLTPLRVGHELIRDAEVFRLCIPASETKSSREIMLDRPAILSVPLERYLRRDRPFLLGEH